MTAVGRQLGHASLDSTDWRARLADAEAQRQIAAVEYRPRSSRRPSHRMRT